MHKTISSQTGTSGTIFNSSPASFLSAASSTEAADVLFTPFPVLASTHLCLDLLVQGSTLDLRMVSELLGRDPGAVLRLFALIAEEFPDPHSRPERIEDCIASVQSSDLLHALCTPPSVREEQMRLIGFAHHGFTVAGYARAVATSLGLCEDRAYLVGLLHALDTLPSALGRFDLIGDTDTADTSARIASAISARHHLPPLLSQALLSIHRRDTASVWMAILDAAHDLAEREGTFAAL